MQVLSDFIAFIAPHCTPLHSLRVDYALLGKKVSSTTQEYGCPDNKDILGCVSVLPKRHGVIWRLLSRLVHWRGLGEIAFRNAQGDAVSGVVAIVEGDSIRAIA